MSLATDFDDFLRWAPRKPIGIEEDIPTGPVSNEPVLDRDSLEIFNQAMPLNKLADAAESSLLPSWSRADLALIALTRAIELGDDSLAARVAPILAKAHPVWASDLQAYVNASGEEKRFAADLLIARHAELQVVQEPRFRKDPPNDGWWCAPTKPIGDRNPLAQKILSTDELREGAEQRKRLEDGGAAQALIAPSVMAWANAHADDSRVPEALYRLVRMTRYGCRGLAGVNGPISKAAYDLLHQKYPASDWTKKTPYWFKD
jgi:hypothetical protein